MTSRAYAAASAELPLPKGHTGGLVGAVERYSAFFRDGRLDLPHVGKGPARISRVHVSESGEGLVRKFCQSVPRDVAQGDLPGGADGEMLETESVLIPMIGKKRILTHTLCLSSQVGCAMGCTFCQTAQMGKIRDLTAGEIVGQWFAARHLVRTSRSIAGEAEEAVGCETIRNIVFMGMGEPMDNLENVIQAIAVLTDSRGVNMPMSRITISTVGRIDGIRRLAEQVRRPGWHRLNLAVSLNAPNDEIRSRIMPVNRKYPMAELREAILEWPYFGGAKICFEYVLIPGVNDAREHAAQLADFVLGRGEYAGSRRRAGTMEGDCRGSLHGMVNVIPYNPRDNSPWEAPSEEKADEFLSWLIEEGVFAKRRRTKGRDTMAACGQLGNPAMRRKKAETRTPIIPTISINN